MIEIYAKHKHWIRIAVSYGVTDYPEDIVQEAYIKIHGKENINSSYFHSVIRSICLDSQKKRKIQTVPIIENLDQIDEDFEKPDINPILDFINTWHWFDKMFYLQYIENKTSLRKFAKKYDYDYQFVYRTLLKINKKLLDYGIKNNR